MTKARRMIEASLGSVDMTLELLDARIPLSSENPDINKILGQREKPRLVVLNKSDLADPEQNKKWVEYFRETGRDAVLYNSKRSGGNAVTDSIKKVFAERTARNQSRGMGGKAIKIMVLGIPNVGKSTLINNLCGSARAKAEDRPGVTRGKQWISAGNGIDLLDMPGILWPKLDDRKASLHLAMTGAIKDDIVDSEELASSLSLLLAADYPDLLIKRYKLDNPLSDNGFELLKAIGKKRGFVVSGGEIDTERAAKILLDEFRAAKIGQITLDRI